MNDEQAQIELTDTQKYRALFKPASWAAKINFINHLILLNNVLITVIAEKQGGKSSFNTLLHDNLDKQIQSVALTIQSSCKEQQIVDALCKQLGLKHDPGCNIASLVVQIHDNKNHVLLVIDDAQNLPEHLVRDIMWAIKSQGDFGFFHVCLISDYSIVDTLKQLSASQLNNLIHTIELGALSESEMRTYVLQRGMSTHLLSKPLPENQLKKIYKQTKGNIANINKNLENLVSSSPMIQIPAINSKVLKSAGLAVAAFTAIGLSYSYWDGFKSTRHLPYMENSTIPMTSESAILQEGSLDQSAAEIHPEIELITDVERLAADDKPLISSIPSLLESSNVELVDAGSAMQMQAEALEEALAQASSERHLSQQEQVAGEIQLTKEPQMPQEGPQEALNQPDLAIQDTAETSSPNISTLVEESMPIAVVAETNTALADSAKLSANDTYKKTSVTQAKQPSPKPKMAQTKATVLAKKTIKNKNTLLEKGGYTIQLTASHNIKDILRFKKSHNIFVKTTIRHFTNEQGHWYLLTYGDYKNKNQAVAHSNDLPPQFAKLKPWIRTLSGLNVVQRG